MAASVSGTEKTTTTPASAGTPSSASASASATAPAPAPKLRSCVGCRSRKVRCDKQSPCSNCRRGNIPCVLPSNDRPPKWARRLQRLANTHAAASNATGSPEAEPAFGKVMDRLQDLESLVRDLSAQLEQARAAARSAGAGSGGFNSPSSSTQDHDANPQRDSPSATNPDKVQQQFGRLVLQDSSRSRYVSSGFWSWVNDELDGLKIDVPGTANDESDSSGDEASSGKSPFSQELERTASERHAFLFRHNVSSSIHDLREFHPLPSQVSFLLEVFSTNVNMVFQVVHIPTVAKMIRDLRGSHMSCLTPANEALMFSIYYSAIISMEEKDILNDFGASKSDLSLKYRLGLEHALAKADFLNAPSITLVQAFGLFLNVVRRHDSPRFVWMMTGLIIRMAQFLGLQRDGTHFEHLTPYEIEMRRRVWWTVIALDLRASEDQGTDITIADGSFDTKLPLNINDADITPETKEMPPERDGMTDNSIARMIWGLGEMSRQLMAAGVRDGAAGMENRDRLLSEMYQKYEHSYFQPLVEPGNIYYWLASTVARIVMAKLTLLVYLPVLFSSPSEDFSEDMRVKLLVSAIEVAEYNHALNAEQSCRQWHWIYQTHTHWYATVYLMIETSRRPWSPLSERAWVALHSPWLIPAHTPADKDLRIWVPLRRLMAKARRHRDAELHRLRADPRAAAQLETEDRAFPSPSSPAPVPAGSGPDVLRERWIQLVGLAPPPGEGSQMPYLPSAGPTGTRDPADYTSHQPTGGATSVYNSGGAGFGTTHNGVYSDPSGNLVDGTMENTGIPDFGAPTMANPPIDLASEQAADPSHVPFPTGPADWSDGRAMGPALNSWLWADADPSVDVFSDFDASGLDVDMDWAGETNWYHWIQSAEGLEQAAAPAHPHGWV